MENYLEYDPYTNKAKYVSDLIINGRRMCLYGIPVVFTQTEGSDVRMEPCFPAMSPLIWLIKASPEYSAFIWDDKTKEWSVFEC